MTGENHRQPYRETTMFRLPLFRSARLSRLAGFFATLLLCSALADAKPIAIIADTKGEVKVGAQAAKIMTELTRDSEVDLGADARASVMFIATGKEFSLRGPGRFVVEDAQVKAKAGPAPAARQTAWRVSNDVVVKVGETAPASIRMRSFAPPRVELVSPREGKLLQMKPVFTWQAGGSTVPVQFELVEGTAESVISARAEGEKFVLPANVTLRPGKTYQWGVKRMDQPEQQARATFTTASADEITRLTKLKPKESAPIADWVMYGLTLHETGAFAEAKSVWERLAKVRPEFAELIAK
jgi:hypothetical protein